MDLTQFQLSQMLAPFSRDESQRTVSKVRKRKIKFLCCVHPVHKAGARNVSCYRRAMTATKCTKKRDARAKLLPCQSKPVVFLPFLFSSPSLLLKLPLIVIQKFCYHGNVTSHFSSLKNQLVPTATRTSNLRPLLRMLVCQEGRRRWVRGCIKITESMHAYGFQVLPSPLFFWSAACRYSCSQKGYPLTIIT